MSEILVRQGYDLRLVGEPTHAIVEADFPSRVGIRPPEFRGLKPSVLIEVGQEVKTGTPLLADKKDHEIVLVSPATGKVCQIKRGPRRRLLEISVEVGESEEFEELGSLDPGSASSEEIKVRLLRSGLWPLLRQHPFPKVANPKDVPKSIFVSAAQSEPFGPDPNFVLSGQESALQVGLTALGKLTKGAVHLTTRHGQSLCPALAKAEGVEKHTVRGPHPSNDPTVQAFYIDRIKPGEVIWHLGAQDVALIGSMLLSGRYPTMRIIALAGNGVLEQHRRYYKIRAGAQLRTLVEGKLAPGEQRIISGDVLTGTKVDPENCLSHYDGLVSVIPEGNDRRELLGWLWPGLNKYSWSRTFLSALAPAKKRFETDTNLNGGLRACIQSGYCLKVCPIDIQPLFIWKAVSYGDIEEAEQLGILDCVECGLCTYVCPSKIEIDEILRQGLDQIEKEVSHR